MPNLLDLRETILVIILIKTLTTKQDGINYSDQVEHIRGEKFQIHFFSDRLLYVLHTHLIHPPGKYAGSFSKNTSVQSADVPLC